MGITTSTLSFSVLALMCGRTVVSLAPDDIIRACSFRDRNGKRKRPAWKDAPGGQHCRTSFNMAPGSFSPVLVSSDHFGDGELQKESERVLTPMKWGLVPPWHQGDPFKVPYETNNCRAESMLEKKVYKVPLRRGFRCVILIDGFYEWKTTKDGKQPYFFYFPSKDNVPLSKSDREELIDKSSYVKKEIIDIKSSNVKKEGVEVLEEVKLEDYKVCKEAYKLATKSESFDDDGDDELIAAAMRQDGFESSSSIKHNCNVKSQCQTPSNAENEAKVTVKEECHESMPQTIQTTTTQPPFCETMKQEVASKLLQSSSGRSSLHGHGNDIDQDFEWTGQRLLTIAGVFDVWKSSKDGESIYSYSVITVPASKDMDWCHHRMPAILPTEEDVKDWLDFANIPIQKVSSLIKPQECLTSHPVSKKVNSSRYQAPDCIKPVDLSVESKPKLTASSSLMMNWLTGGQGKMNSPSSPIKRAKIDVKERN